MQEQVYYHFLEESNSKNLRDLSFIKDLLEKMTNFLLSGRKLKILREGGNNYKTFHE